MHNNEIIPIGFSETLEKVNEQMNVLVTVVDKLKELGVKVECSFNSEELFDKAFFKI